MSDPSPSSAAPQPSNLMRWLGAGYCAFFVVTLVVAYTGHLPVGALSRIHNADKIGHLVLYCIPTYLGHHLCRHRHIHRWRLTIPLFPAVFMLFTLTEELVQGYSPNRTLDIGDLVCSALGIAIGYWLAQRQAVKN